MGITIPKKIRKTYELNSKQIPSYENDELIHNFIKQTTSRNFYYVSRLQLGLKYTTRDVPIIYA